MPSFPDLFTRALALLAFVVAFYALAARERKTPYITNFIYTTTLWIFLSLILQLVSQVIATYAPRTSNALQYGAQAFLIIGSLNVAYGIWRIHNRHINFRDDVQIKSLWFIRKIRRFITSRRDKIPYELDPPDLLPDLGDAIVECKGLDKEQLEIAVTQVSHFKNDKLSKSIIYHSASVLESDDLLIRLAQSLLTRDWAVQYTTCIRHPIEFVIKLRDYLEEQKTGASRELLKQVVVIDAYTPHFGFTDSIHIEKTASLKKLAVPCVTSSPSYAGIHTATAKAFNELKRQQSKQNRSRKPTLIIYEGAYALVDLESIEQYRIFLRHVLPSERLWGGMLTCVVEPVINEDGLPVLTTYADILLEKKKGSVLLESQPVQAAMEQSHEVK